MIESELLAEIRRLEKKIERLEQHKHGADDITTIRWEDLRVSVNSVKVPAAGYPDWGAFMTDTQILWFDPGTEQYVYFSVQMPHNWIEGSAIYPHVHWTPATTADGNPANQSVTWQLTYTWADVGQDFPATATAYASVHFPADADVVAGRHYMTSFAAITPNATTQNNISSMINCRLSRDAAGGNDTYEHDAGLLEFDIHYQVDGFGSVQESSKT